MSMQEVYELLSKNRYIWFTLDEISEKLGINKVSVSKNISKLGYCIERRDQLVGRKIEIRYKEE